MTALRGIWVVDFVGFRTMKSMDKVKENKLAFGGAGVLALAAIAWLAFGFFGIQTAFIDNVVDEGGPVFAITAPAAGSDESAAGVVETEPLEAPTTVPTGPAEAAPAEVVPDVAVPAEAAPEADVVPDVAVPAEPAPEADVVPDVAVPEAEAEAPVPEEPAQAPGEIVTTFSGSFGPVNGYDVTGEALVLENGTDQRFLRLENFASPNGPDLKVYLRAANGDFVSLGDLTGNIGDQNYEIPAGVDLNEFSSVEIWCERFSVGFGEATLSAS